MSQQEKNSHNKRQPALAENDTLAKNDTLAENDTKDNDYTAAKDTNLADSCGKQHWKEPCCRRCYPRNNQ